MSPEPYVRAQALALALLLVAAAAFGSPVAALSTAAVAAAAAWALKAKYRRDVATAQVVIPHHRERLDRIVAGDAQAALGVGLTAGALLTGLHVPVPETVFAPATPVLVAATAAAIYLSSLVDWYITLPRISGLLGSRPCRPRDPDHPTFPKTWRETTRWWYGHRVAAAVTLRYGPAFAITFTLGPYLSFPRGANLVAGALLGFLAPYMRSVPWAAFQAGHPTAIVGRTVRMRQVRRRRVVLLRVRGRAITLPGLRRVAFGPTGPREYVFDVALEGAQLARVDVREKDIPRTADGEVDFERSPRKVNIKEVYGCGPAESAFSGCDASCSGINWYCIENPRCFEVK